VSQARADARPQAQDAWPAREVKRIEHCTSLGYEICANAHDDNCNGVPDEGCGIPTGVIQFMIAWQSTKADVDLNVVDPNGELIEGGRVSKSGLVKERDCPGRRQECHGQNLENVFLEGTYKPLRGTYRLSITLEELDGEQPPIWVTLSSRLGFQSYAFEMALVEAEDERELELEF
jgi:tRNA (guanosine-2'-O-)-methyltransferase